jgi:FAD/FMN-containing dehydrogenase
VDERRARIFDDLRDVVAGELYFEALDRAPYAHDASLYEIDPLGAIVPRTEDDVVTVVRYAAEHRIPVHARGAGTDTGGGALGPGIVLDLSQHLRKVITIALDHVVVEPGVVPDFLNAQLAPLGRRLEPIPGNSDVTTIGGMIAVDAAGSRSMRYGSIGDQIERLSVVFAGGEVAELDHESWPAFESEPIDLKGVILRKLQTLYRRTAGRLPQAGAAAPRNRAGFALGKAASEGGIHLGRLVAGSEGTLALVIRAVLKTIPLPAAQGVALLPFLRLSDAAEFVPELLNSSLAPSSCDLLDRRSLRLARDAIPSLREAIVEAAESLVIVEFEDSSPEEAADRVRLAGERAARGGRLCAEHSVCFKRGDCERIVGWRRPVESLLMRMRGPARPVSVIDDIAVPPSQLAATVQQLQCLLQQHNRNWTLDAYAGEGRIRLRPFFDLSKPDERTSLESLAARVCDIVLDAGGTISSSQSCGLVRTQFLRKQYGDLIPVFREIKDAFDPLNQLNPGKVIGDDPHLMVHNLRALAFVPDGATLEQRLGSSAGSDDAAGSEPADGEGDRTDPDAAGEGVRSPVESAVIQPVLLWPDLQLLDMASACHGCGSCRTFDPALRMCPSFRALRQEAASPRSQANLLRQVATGLVDPRSWGSEELKAHADLCIHCKLCQL